MAAIVLSPAMDLLI